MLRAEPGRGPPSLPQAEPLDLFRSGKKQDTGARQTAGRNRGSLHFARVVKMKNVSLLVVSHPGQSDERAREMNEETDCPLP